ncbi:MAG: 2-amino-4-hydroxy-6-hydroxymethyldihydropteridine diphosphokinase, partial [Coriobacteriia bacterium]|nr:2-amino-4-hydroxy-6-hydroxymethyldihydropteridine diphosphokinase [Coriobacteriia bacterium]
FGPRPIDLDILLFGDEEWVAATLTIPHPRLLERDFVVTPLLEVAPDAVLPDGTPITRERAREGRVTGILGALPGFEDLTPLGPGDPGQDGGPTAAQVVPTAQEARGEWVAVGPARFEVTVPNSSSDFSLLLYEQELLQAGIPCVFYPHRPGEGASVLYAIPQDVRLMVPASRAGEAQAIIDAQRVGEARSGRRRFGFE